MKGSAQARSFSAVLATALALGGCQIGRGSGEVVSDHLVAAGCADGPFDLAPTFYASNPFENTQIIRIQHGEALAERSDGLSISLPDVLAISGSEDSPGRLGEELPVALPVGVAPPGVPVMPNSNPPLATMTLYLNDSCHEQDVTLEAISGTIQFEHLFDGDLTERKKAERQIQGSFDVMFADPRDIPPGGTSVDEIPVELQSRVTGTFDFYYRRAQPAQPFP